VEERKDQQHCSSNGAVVDGAISVRQHVGGQELEWPVR
jgi:hypothetical protein